MKIYFKEISETETELDFTEKEPWVAECVSRLDERDQVDPRPRTAARPVALHFSLRKVDDVVVVDSSIRTAVQLLCSRCASAFPLPIDAAFSTLFCQDPAMAGIAHLDPNHKDMPTGRNQGHARHEHDKNSGADSLDITYVAEDSIDLGEVMAEQLRLQIPFQPLCREDCQGICPHCGADWNTGRCACAKLHKTTPFSVLENLKPSLKTSVKDDVKTEKKS